MSTTTLVRWGNGQGVRINRDVMEAAGAKVGDSFDIHVENGDIILTPRQARTVTIPDFESMFANYHGTATHDDGFSDDGFSQPVGGEVL